jgi:hypothetical protein
LAREFNGNPVAFKKIKNTFLGLLERKIKTRNLFNPDQQESERVQDQFTRKSHEKSEEN